MKTVTKNINNLSVYLFEDTVNFTIEADRITTPKFIVSDLNSSNCTVHNNVTAPNDWVGSKYIYDGSSWSISPDYTTPPEVS